MNIENIKSQMRKGLLEYCVLLILKNKEAYASDIINILQKTNLIVVEGTLYPLLTRLKNDNLLSYQWVESNQGPPRKYYRLTEQGLEFFFELEKSWDNINNSINQLKIKR
ncbi:MAG: PadR family transcriptional regulator [Prevotellaceae bacterium]|nr:PadR family transcriptional regulator [Prevotellaceae bacterium]